MRGGQGQFGIITEAWIRLRRTGRRFRRYELRYGDPDRFARDFESLVDEDRFDHLRAEIRGHGKRVVLRAGAEYDGQIDDGRALEGLGYDTMSIVWDLPDTGPGGVPPSWVRAGMMPGWMFAPEDHHPWRDWFLPWEALRTALGQPWLDLRHLPRPPRRWIGIQPIGTVGPIGPVGRGAVDAPLVARPEGCRMFSYSIFAATRDYAEARALAERLKQVDRAIVALGGKAYLSGAAGYGRREWEEHYGGMFETGIRWKRTFDPDNVFRAGGLPFGREP